MKRPLVVWPLTLVAMAVFLTACCCGGGETETVVVVPAEGSAAPEAGATAGQQLQDLKGAHDEGAISDKEFEKAKEKVLKQE